MGIISFLGGGEVKAPRSERHIRRGARMSRRRGARAEDEYLDRATDFDATEAATRASEAQYSAINEDLVEGIRELRGQQVGAGRRGTGYGFGDEDELVTDANERIARAVAANSMGAARLNLANTQDLGRYGSRASERSLDAYSGLADREQARENERRRQRFGLLQGAAGLAGSVFGPVGAAAGKKLSERLFS